MSSEETRTGRPSGMTGHHAPEAIDHEIGATAAPDTAHPDLRRAMGDRKRNAEWPEVHDAFDTRTEDVDPRATGDPVGTPPDERPTGPVSQPDQA
ncbi:MAG TPA: hypothetical protein VHB98_21765 [Chloroflexota bacterium]|nr:hypothetical protein [Chloroflexota bacterium]